MRRKGTTPAGFFPRREKGGVRPYAREDDYVGGYPRPDGRRVAPGQGARPTPTAATGRVQRFIVLGDRQSGKLIGVSFWESEEAMQASEDVGDRMRSESAEAMSDTIAGVEWYEVGLFEVSS